MPTITVIQPTLKTQTNEKLRVAAYCRVSSGSEEQLHSYAAQVAYYRQKFEESETETLVDVYADEGVTGTREDKRDELQRLLRDCRRGKVDRIYTKSISRFSRNTRDCLKSVRELKALGITIFFEKENIDTANMSDEMMITIMGGLAQEESTSISQNMRWAYQKQMQNGTIHQHSAPYGYVLKDGQLVVNPEQAEVVKEIFDFFLGGDGYVAICEKLNKAHHSKREDGLKWTVSAVEYILKNERYIGDSLWQKSYNAGIPFKKQRNHGEREQFYLTNTHESIISADVFQNVRELIAKRRHSRKVLNEYPLSKKIRCGICGTVYKRMERKTRISWVCYKHFELAASCKSKPLKQPDIYAAFISLHNKLLMNHKNILIPLQIGIQELNAKQFGGNPRIMDIHRETAKLREQSHVIARLKTKGFLDDAKYAEQSATLNAKLAKLQKELQKLTKSDDEDDTLKELDMLIDYFEKRQNIMIEFEEATFAQIIDGIVVRNGDELEFRLIGGITLSERI